MILCCSKEDKNDKKTIGRKMSLSSGGKCFLNIYCRLLWSYTNKSFTMLRIHGYILISGKTLLHSLYPSASSACSNSQLKTLIFGPSSNGTSGKPITIGLVCHCMNLLWSYAYCRETCQSLLLLN